MGVIPVPLKLIEKFLEGLLPVNVTAPAGKFFQASLPTRYCGVDFSQFAPSKSKGLKSSPVSLLVTKKPTVLQIQRRLLASYIHPIRYNLLQFFTSVKGSL